MESDVEACGGCGDAYCAPCEECEYPSCECECECEELEP